MTTEIDRAWVQQDRIPDRDVDLRVAAYHLITLMEDGIDWDENEKKKLKEWVAKFKKLWNSKSKAWRSAQKKAYPDVIRVMRKAVYLEQDLYLQSFTDLPREKIRKAIQDKKLRFIDDSELGKLYLYNIDRLEEREIRWALKKIWAVLHNSPNGEKLLKTLKKARAHSSNPVVIAEYKQGERALGLNANYDNLAIAGIGDGTMVWYKYSRNRQQMVNILSNELFEAVWGLLSETHFMEVQVLSYFVSEKLAKKALGKKFDLKGDEVAAIIKIYLKGGSPFYELKDYSKFQEITNAMAEFLTDGARTSLLQLWPLGHLAADCTGWVTIRGQAKEAKSGIGLTKGKFSGSGSTLKISPADGTYDFLEKRSYVYGDFKGELLFDLAKPTPETLSVPASLKAKLGKGTVSYPRHITYEYDWKLVTAGKESGKGYFLIDFEKTYPWFGEWGVGAKRKGGGVWIAKRTIY